MPPCHAQVQCVCKPLDGLHANNANILRAQMGNFLQTSDGGFLISGHKDAGVSWYRDGMLLLKTDSNGTVEWARRNSDSDTWSVDYGLGAIQASDGGFYMVGTMEDNLSPYYTGGVLYKTDNLGVVGCDDFTDTVIASSLLLADSSIALTDSIVNITSYNVPVTSTAISQTYLDYCIPNSVIEKPMATDKPVLYPNPTTGRLQ